MLPSVQIFFAMLPSIVLMLMMVSRFSKLFRKLMSWLLPPRNTIYEGYILVMCLYSCMALIKNLYMSNDAWDACFFPLVDSYH